MMSSAIVQSDPIDGQFLELIFARYEIIYANPRSVRGGRGFNITYIHIHTVLFALDTIINVHTDVIHRVQ